MFTKNINAYNHVDKTNPSYIDAYIFQKNRKVEWPKPFVNQRIKIVRYITFYYHHIISYYETFY